MYYPRNPTSIILLPQNPIWDTQFVSSIFKCIPQRAKLDANVPWIRSTHHQYPPQSTGPGSSGYESQPATLPNTFRLTSGSRNLPALRSWISFRINSDPPTKPGNRPPLTRDPPQLAWEGLRDLRRNDRRRQSSCQFSAVRAAKTGRDFELHLSGPISTFDRA